MTLHLYEYIPRETYSNLGALQHHLNTGSDASESDRDMKVSIFVPHLASFGWEVNRRQPELSRLRRLMTPLLTRYLDSVLGA